MVCPNVLSAHPRVVADHADRFGVRLTIVPGVNRGEELALRLHQLGQLGHEDAAVRGGEQLPRGVLESGARGADGSVNILLPGGLDSSNGFFGAVSTLEGKQLGAGDKMKHTRGRLR